MFDDISFLVSETLKDAESKQEPKAGLFSSFFGNSREEELPEEVPGLFYHLQIKASTFVIRIHTSENLREDYKSIMKHPDMYPSLRLEEGSDELRDKVQYFECDSVNVARSIKKQLGNKRFPLYEENVFNVSDPSDSWWVAANDTKISIYFKLSQTKNLSNLTKIGPLGDSSESLETFSQLYGYFKMLFPIEDYSSAHGQFSMSVSSDDNLMFNLFKKLLVEGEVDHEFWEYLRNLEFNSAEQPYYDSLKKANYFMMELAMLRNFWKTIETQLD
jgi:hypothetical protein